jgi:hypothetical protein
LLAPKRLGAFAGPVWHGEILVAPALACEPLLLVIERVVPRRLELGELFGAKIGEPPRGFRPASPLGATLLGLLGSVGIGGCWAGRFWCRAGAVSRLRRVLR